MTVDVRGEHVATVGLLADALLGHNEIVHRGRVEAVSATHNLIAVTPLVRVATVGEVPTESGLGLAGQLDNHVALRLGVGVLEAAIEVVEVLDKAGLVAATGRIGAERAQAGRHRVVEQAGREVDRAVGALARHPLQPLRIPLVLDEVDQFGLVRHTRPRVLVGYIPLDHVLQRVVVEQNRVLLARLAWPRQLVVVGGRERLPVLTLTECERLWWQALIVSQHLFVLRVDSTHFCYIIILLNSKNYG